MCCYNVISHLYNILFFLTLLLLLICLNVCSSLSQEIFNCNWPYIWLQDTYCDIARYFFVIFIGAQ